MSTYASIIVPTHDRASTLPSAIASIQRQSVDNIEILIVGDGPTPEISAAAEALAKQDRRIRFLVFDKAPGDGGRNRDRGVHEAQSERIFYCDDDDVWLPQHIETIGPHLNQFDIVDTLPVSVGAIPLGPLPRLHATLVNSGNSHTRALLAQDRLKLIFDTHVAHRKSCYLSLGNPWIAARGPSVCSLFAAFASTSHVRWQTLPTMTALSLHGAARTEATMTSRRKEIESLLDRSASLTPDRLLSQVDFTWHSVRTFWSEPPSDEDDAASYFARFGIEWDGRTAPRAGDANVFLAVSLSERQRRTIELVFALFQGRKEDSEELPRVTTFLLDAVLSSVISMEYAQRVLRSFGPTRTIDIIQRIRLQQPEADHLASLLEGYCLRDAGRIREARAIAERLKEDGRLRDYDLTRLFVQIELAEGAVDAAVARLESAWRQSPRNVVIGLELAATLLAIGRPHQALSVCRSVERQILDHSWLRSLISAAEAQTK